MFAGRIKIYWWRGQYDISSILCNRKHFHRAAISIPSCRNWLNHFRKLTTKNSDMDFSNKHSSRHYSTFGDPLDAIRFEQICHCCVSVYAFSILCTALLNPCPWLWLRVEKDVTSTVKTYLLKEVYAGQFINNCWSAKLYLCPETRFWYLLIGM